MYFYLSSSISFFFGKKIPSQILRLKFICQNPRCFRFLYRHSVLMTEYVFDVQINKKQTEEQKETAKEYILP